MSRPRPTGALTTEPPTRTHSIEPSPACRSTTAPSSSCTTSRNDPSPRSRRPLARPRERSSPELHRARAGLESALAKESDEQPAPPTDSEIREQLARRSAGRLPDGLLIDISAALDGVLDGVREPRARARWPRLIWSVPRLAVAGMGVALVAVLAAAIAFRGVASRTGGIACRLPAERALTTAELARLMAGPALPANTTLVASVTIDARTDVCPMNSRPTIGVVEGMSSQVCVMGATLARSLPVRRDGRLRLPVHRPGYLGLLGEITPASDSRLAFGAADGWPLAGKTFLVEGWLGAYPISCRRTSPPRAAIRLIPTDRISARSTG